jgi:hypothetical protein
LPLYVFDCMKETKDITVSKIYGGLTKQSKRFEDKHGLMYISSVVDCKLAPLENLSFIESYRGLIRGNVWYHDECPDTSYTDLMQRWNLSSKQYQKSGELFFDYVAGKEVRKFFELHQIALQSETARKRDGKGSQIGLDAFLDSYIGRLDHLIRGVYDEIDSEDIVGLLASTIGAPFISAENELYLDFARYTEITNQPLTHKIYECLGGEGQEHVGKVLREYCKYSIRDFNDKLKRMKPTSELANKKRDTLSSIENERRTVTNETYTTISRRGSGDDAFEFLTLLDKINELNYLNTNTEVKFSFKGAPGLFHYFIFNEAQRKHSEIEDVYHRDFILHNSKGGLLV